MYGSTKKNSSYSNGKGRGTTPPKRPSSSSSSKQHHHDNNNNDNNNNNNGSVVELEEGDELDEVGSSETGANPSQRTDRDNTERERATEREMKRTIELLRLEIETYKGKKSPLILFYRNSNLPSPYTTLTLICSYPNLPLPCSIPTHLTPTHLIPAQGANKSRTSCSWPTNHSQPTTTTTTTTTFHHRHLRHHRNTSGPPLPPAAPPAPPTTRQRCLH